MYCFIRIPKSNQIKTKIWKSFHIHNQINKIKKKKIKITKSNSKILKTTVTFHQTAVRRLQVTKINTKKNIKKENNNRRR